MLKAMRKRTYCLAIAIFAAVLGIFISAGRGDTAAQEIKARNAAEFIEALGSDRTIILSSDGDFAITDARKTAKMPDCAYWSEEFDGPQLNIFGVENLVIRGEPSEGDVFGAMLTAEPRYANVLNFDGCEKVTIETLWAGHTEGGECTGGVLRFVRCRDIILSELDLTGSGVTGVELEKTNNVSVTGCVITDCTIHAASIIESANAEFNNVVFDQIAGDYGTIFIHGSEFVTFEKCLFIGNTGSAFSVSRSENIIVRDWKILDCDYDELDPSNIVIFEEGD
ncbi:MAG: right-handed parallel beta-helix repeat-containing protein [Synergistaceae bacterium]|nr:right-handed parallel beta-helix repeat-containing protein [Synergistaceae bacterium]